MSWLPNFNTFINEGIEEDYPGLKRIYLCTMRSSGQAWLSYKGFAGNKFFIQITERNIDKIKINPEFPVLNYQSTLVNQLLTAGRIKDENVYNHPDDIELSGSKVKFHELVGDSPHVPKTVFTKEDAKELAFPVIAKPASRHSGLGISVFKTAEELSLADNSKYDTYSEFIDKKSEHRFFTLRGEPIFWMERTPQNKKAKTGEGNVDEQMKFAYERRDVSTIPKKYREVLDEFCDRFSKLPFICFDIMEDREGKVYVIESNAQPGVPFDSTAVIYEKIYEDYYKTKLDPQSKSRLDDISKELVQMTIKKDPDRFN